MPTTTTPRPTPSPAPASPAPGPRTARAATPVREAARAALDPATLRAAVRANPMDATVAAAARCGVSAALALGALVAVGHTELAGMAGLGALTSLYGRYDPYRRRVSLLTLVAVLIVGGIALTSTLAAAGSPTVVGLLVVTVFAAGMTALCHVLRTGAPGPTIVVFAVGAGLSGAPSAADVGHRVAAAAVGAALAWLVCCAGYLVRPNAPARLAVRRAARAAYAVDAAATDGPHAAAERATARTRALQAVDAARAVVADDLSHRRTAATARRLESDLDVLESGLAPGEPLTPTPARRTLRATARAGLAAGAWHQQTLRVLVASLAASGLVSAAGLSHAAWAAIGATAALSGTSTHHVTVRAVQRGVGTLVGAAVAWALLAAHLDFAATFAVVVALTFVTELVVGRNYLVAMFTITPMALLMGSIGSVVDPETVARDRALDTLVGVAVGVAAAVLVHPRRR